MGGAATALTLARLIMEDRLDVRLRVLIPIVENAISGAAMRPGDIYAQPQGADRRDRQHRRRRPPDPRRRAGAGGRGGAGTAARFRHPDRRRPGRARPRPAAVLHRRRRARRRDRPIRRRATRDPVWRLPLWRPYDAMLDSPVADLNNAPGSPFAGSITAALFLRASPRARSPGRISTSTPGTRKPRATGPQGGEIQAARALHALLAARFPAGETENSANARD